MSAWVTAQSGRVFNLDTIQALDVTSSFTCGVLARFTDGSSAEIAGGYATTPEAEAARVAILMGSPIPAP